MAESKYGKYIVTELKIPEDRQKIAEFMPPMPPESYGWTITWLKGLFT